MLPELRRIFINFISFLKRRKFNNFVSIEVSKLQKSNKMKYQTNKRSISLDVRQK